MRKYRRFSESKWKRKKKKKLNKNIESSTRVNSIVSATFNVTLLYFHFYSVCRRFFFSLVFISILFFLFFLHFSLFFFSLPFFPTRASSATECEEAVRIESRKLELHKKKLHHCIDSIMMWSNNVLRCRQRYHSVSFCVSGDREKVQVQQ